MDTLTKMSVAKKYSCPYCLIKKQTKDTFNRHIGLCKFIHTSSKEHKINSDTLEEVPNQHILLQYILDLSEKYEKLEAKVNKMQNASFQLRKKNVDEYIKTIAPCPILFSDWVQKCVVSDKALKSLFENDIKECLKILIYQTLEENDDIPLKAFTQRPNTIFIYDESKDDNKYVWRPLIHQELEHYTRILCHRILKKYLEWTRDHSNDLERDSKLQELSMIYLNKANGSSTTLEQRMTEVRKAIISNVQISLKNLE